MVVSIEGFKVPCRSVSGVLIKKTSMDAWTPKVCSILAFGAVKVVGQRLVRTLRVPV